MNEIAPHVTTQSYARPRFTARANGAFGYDRTYGPARWAFVVHIPGEQPFVSQYRYATEETAERRGAECLAATVDLLCVPGEHDWSPASDHCLACGWSRQAVAHAQGIAR